MMVPFQRFMMCARIPVSAMRATGNIRAGPSECKDALSPSLLLPMHRSGIQPRPVGAYRALLEVLPLWFPNGDNMALGRYGSRHLPPLMSLSPVRTITIGSRVVPSTVRHLALAFATPTETTVPVELSAPENASCSVLTKILAPTHWTDCYQCGKCTAGCPVAAAVDMAPNQVVRALQLGNFEIAMASDTIWACVSCQTCSTRCPQSVDCAGIMDALREVSLAAWRRLTRAKNRSGFSTGFPE